MGRAELIVESGPDKGRKFALDAKRNRVTFGSSVAGDGRLEAPRGGNLAGEHITLWLHQFGLEVEDVKATTYVMYSGGASRGTMLNPGAMLVFAERDPRQLRRDIAVIRVKEVVPGPTFGLVDGALCDAVTWKTGGWRKQRGVLEAVDGRVRLHDKEGPLFDVPYTGMRASFPARRSGVITLSPGDETYKVFLGGGDGAPSLGGDTSAGSIGGVGGEGAEFLGILDVIIMVGNAVDKRARRRDWKSVLSGERTAAEVAAEWREKAALG